MEVSGGGNEPELTEETQGEILQREKQYLVQDIAEEIEHLSKQLAVANENIQKVLQNQSELDTFAEQWSQFQAQCKKTEGSS